MALPETRPVGAECLARDCSHAESEHTLTPELAGPAETVVWCSACRRHEVRRPSRFRLFGFGGSSDRARRRFSGAA